MSEPFVVCCHGRAAPDRLLRLADVIVTGPAGPDRIAELFTACPGLTLVVAVDVDGTVALYPRSGSDSSARRAGARDEPRSS
ncbi:hypothetical protein AB0M54_10165 [Actinoplanes sp. NPDC051470]|uniref:hypothetical protein n=1 Tax=Actinoplanes sp. NPDC051470 TaxID=3157224 RepID=UPI00343887F9